MFDPRSHTLLTQGSIPEFKEDKDPHDWLYIPARWAVVAALVANTTIVLPKHPNIEALVHFLESTVARHVRKKMQVIWTPGKEYLLDDEIRDCVLPEVKNVIRVHGNNSRVTTVVPYRVNAPFESWAGQLSDINVVGDTADFITSFGNKTILHGSMHEPRLSHGLFTGLDMNIPRGVVCQTRDELRDAYRKLVDLGIGKVIIKPAHGSTGEGIQAVTSMAEVDAYTWDAGGPFILEECLSLDRDSDDQELNCSLQFMGTKILGKPTAQILHGTHWEGNMLPGKWDYKFDAEVLRQTTSALNVLAQYGLKGPGGFDFISSGGKPYLVDPNIGRFTGGHVPRFIEEAFAPGRAWATLEMPHGKDIESGWQTLQNAGLALDFSNKIGVFPFCQLKSMYAMHIAFADSSNAALCMLKRARDLMT